MSIMPHADHEVDATLPMTMEDIRFAAEIFGPISDRHDAEELADLPADGFDAGPDDDDHDDPTYGDVVTRFPLDHPEDFDADPAGPGALENLASRANSRESFEAWMEEQRADFMPVRAWLIDLASACYELRYSPGQVYSMVKVASECGSLECLPDSAFIDPSDRPLLERCIEPAPMADWARHDGEVWNLVETAVGRR